MRISKSVGIVSYGTAVPATTISYQQIQQSQQPFGGTGDVPETDKTTKSPLGVNQKTVPAPDEDAVTLATQAGYCALSRWEDAATKTDTINALFVGSESHPYAVKPTGTLVAGALGLPNTLSVADLEFACKAGTQGMQIGMSYILSGLSEHALAIGADTAQARPGDVLEFTAAAGAMAAVLGKQKLIAKLLATTSYASDTPDFWRREGQPYPEHAGRFTGEPAYFHHVMAATKQILLETNLKPADIDYCVFHTPNGVFPVKVAKKLGFTMHQLEPSLRVKNIGNTYSAAAMLALASVLDVAGPNKTILLTSYGSGAGADSFVFKTTSRLPKFRIRKA